MERQQVEDLLLRHGLFMGRPSVRSEQAMVLSHNPRFTDEAMEGLMSYARRSKLDSGFIIKRLENGDWMSLWADIQRQQKLRSGEKSLEPSVDYATPDNPYGRPPNRMLAVYREWDHNNPNQWNAYRHSFNGPKGERTTTCTLPGYEGVVLSPAGGPERPQVVRKEEWRSGKVDATASPQEAVQKLTEKMTGQPTEKPRWQW
jgi:hypothetical protein